MNFNGGTKTGTKFLLFCFKFWILITKRDNYIIIGYVKNTVQNSIVSQAYPIRLVMFIVKSSFLIFIIIFTEVLYTNNKTLL